MNSWRPYPLLRLLFPFLSGIIIAISSGSFDGGRLWILAIMFCLLVSFRMTSHFRTSYRFRWISGFQINLFLFLAGYSVTCIRCPANDPDYIGRQPEGLFLATVAEPPAMKKGSFKTILQVRCRHQDGRWVRAHGQAVGYLKRTLNERSLQYGDFILLHASFTTIKDNSNPYAFNYFRYLNNKNINHQVFADTRAWKFVNIKSSGVVQKFAFRLRDRLLDVLRSNEVAGREFAVASALLLGYVEELDAGLRRDYAATGAMHILSVSGMHVGIIYIFLEFLLGFLNRRKLLRLLKAIILLTFIWFYAMLTGLSPCVFRSAAMLSLPILGKSLNRSPDMFNVIAASVFILLAIDPFLLLDVGFQLSYLAVLGIVILYKPVYDLYITAAWIPDKIWSILAVSIVAQLATLPITLYTFHQFPNYFMLTNIFVVPLSSLIIYIGIVLMVTGAIPLFSAICAKALIALVCLLNHIIHFIEQLPFSTVSGIYISSWAMVVLYLVIILGALYLFLKHISFLYLSIGAGIVFNLIILNFQVHRLNSSRMIVYNSYRSACYQFSIQDKSVCFYNGSRVNDPTSQKLNSDMVNAAMDAYGIKFSRAFWSGRKDRHAEVAKDFLPVFYSGRFIQFAGARIAILRKPIPARLTRAIHVDFLILSGNPKINLADALKIFHPGQIIIDATNSRMRIMQWLKESAVQQIKCHSVTENGAFEKEI